MSCCSGYCYSCCSGAPVVITISGWALQGRRKMVTIRLTRRGGKKTPFYHVVVTDSRKRQGGTSLESVGLFNPVARGAEIKLRLDVARICPIGSSSSSPSIANRPPEDPERGLER